MHTASFQHPQHFKVTNAQNVFPQLLLQCGVHVRHQFFERSGMNKRAISCSTYKSGTYFSKSCASFMHITSFAQRRPVEMDEHSLLCQANLPEFECRLTICTPSPLVNSLVDVTAAAQSTSAALAPYFQGTHPVTTVKIGMGSVTSRHPVSIHQAAVSKQQEASSNWQAAVSEQQAAIDKKQKMRSTMSH